MKSLSRFSLKPLLLCVAVLFTASTSLHADFAASFLETGIDGETESHHCRFIPSGHDKEWEYYTVIVHVCGNGTTGIRARAKRGVVELKDDHFGMMSADITAKVSKKPIQNKLGQINIELEITKVENIRRTE